MVEADGKAQVLPAGAFKMYVGGNDNTVRDLSARRNILVHALECTCTYIYIYIHIHDKNTENNQNSGCYTLNPNTFFSFSIELK